MVEVLDAARALPITRQKVGAPMNHGQRQEAEPRVFLMLCPASHAVPMGRGTD